MKTTRKSVRAKSVALLASGGLFVLGFGGVCSPDNFWSNTWSAAWAAGADVAIDAFIVDPLEDALASDE